MTDSRSIDKMNKALDVLNRAESYSNDNIQNEAYDSEVNESSNTSSDTSKPLSSIQQMDRILKNFNRTIREAERYSPPDDISVQQLSETNIDKDSKRLSIGEYRIEKTEEGYSLFENEKEILSNVMLYESVYSIATQLYRGSHFNSYTVLKILKLNESYEKYITDARINKSMYKKHKALNESHEIDVVKSRFEENKNKAMTFKRQILKIYKTLK